MTREEAILLSAYTGFLLAPDFSEVHKFCENTLGRPIWTHEFARPALQNEIQEKLHPQIMELVQSISALRPVSREQVEKVWRGEWNQDELGRVVCNRCGSMAAIGTEIALHNAKKYDRFCFYCGAPMTDEAVQMVMERLNKLEETKK
ncbi:MAG: hypothetical protein ACLRQ4_12675 [Neglectibacter timonensis]